MSTGRSTQLEVGAHFDTEARTVTETDVVNFCGVSGDFHALHTDVEYAATTGFGQRLAHGALVLSMATGLRSRESALSAAMVAFVEIREWKFIRPVFIGDTIRARNTVREVRPTSKPGRNVVVQFVEVLNQHGDVVQAGEMVNLLATRAPPA